MATMMKAESWGKLGVGNFKFKCHSLESMANDAARSLAGRHGFIVVTLRFEGDERDHFGNCSAKVYHVTLGKRSSVRGSFDTLNIEGEVWFKIPLDIR